MKRIPAAIIWKLTLLVVLLDVAVVLHTGCARRPNQTEREATTSDKQPPVSLSDTTGAVKQTNIPQSLGNIPQAAPGIPQKPSLLQRVFGTGKVKCKGCIFQNGTGNTAGQNGKKGTAAVGDDANAAGPDTQQATEGSTLTSTGTGNAATVQGDGNDLTQKAEVQQPLDWKATLAKALAGPLGLVIGAAALGGCAYLVILWRRKRAAQNIA